MVVRLTDEVITVIVKKDSQVKVSKDSEDSLNSRILHYKPCTQKDEYDKSGDQCKQCLTRTGESSEHSPESWVETIKKEVDLQGDSSSKLQDIFGAQEICKGDSSESLRESLNCIGNNVSVPNLSWFKSVSKLVGLTAAWQQDKVEEAPLNKYCKQ